MVTSSLADLLASDTVTDKSQSVSLMRRLINLGDVLADIIHNQAIVDRSLNYIRSLSLEHAARLFLKGGDNYFALSIATWSVDLAREMLTGDHTDREDIYLLSESLQALGIIKWTACDIEGAEEAYGEALRVLEEIKSDDVLTRRYFAYALTHLG